MTFTISFGWWLLPLVASLIAPVWWAAAYRRRPRAQSSIGEAVDFALYGLLLLVSLIPGLLAWVIYLAVMS